jgi:hypothetical protein
MPKTYKDNLTRLRKYFSGQTMVVPDVDSKKIKLKTFDPSSSVIAPVTSFGRARAGYSLSSFYNAKHTSQRLFLMQEYDMMETDSIISRALDVLSEETCLKDERDEVIQIDCDDEKIKVTLEHLFYEVMKIDYSLPMYVRQMLKYGDCFLYMNTVNRFGITDIIPLSTLDVERIEDEDYVTTFKVQGVFQDDLKEEQIAHFRWAKNIELLPYGLSILEPVRRFWKQQRLLEDFTMVYYMLRSVNQRVFNIDVTGLDNTQVLPFIEGIRQTFKKAPLVDPDTGEYDLTYDPLTLLDDIVVPIREGYNNTSFDELPASQQTDIIEAIEFFSQKVRAGLGVPNFYLNYEEQINSKCLHPDTKIKLLSGETQTIEQIAKLYEESIKNGNPFDLETYSYDVKSNSIVPSKIRWAEKTRRNAQLVEVILDSGYSIKTTPDHRYIRTGGELVEAKDLKVGDSLQAGYIKFRKLGSGKEYEEVKQPNLNKWVWTHRIVDNYYNGIIENNGYVDGKFNKDELIVVHHKNGNNLDNRISNLQRMTNKNHIEYHHQHAKKYLCSEETRNKIKQTKSTEKFSREQSKRSKYYMNLPHNKFRIRDIWLSLSKEERIAIIKESALKYNFAEKTRQRNIENKSHISLLKGYKDKFPNGRPDLQRENSVMWVERPSVDSILNFIRSYEGDITELNTLKSLGGKMGYDYRILSDSFHSEGVNPVEFLNENIGNLKGRPCNVSKEYLIFILLSHNTKKEIYENTIFTPITLRKNAVRHGIEINLPYDEYTFVPFETVDDLIHAIISIPDIKNKTQHKIASHFNTTANTLSKNFKNLGVTYVEVLNELFGFVKGRPKYLRKDYFMNLSEGYQSEEEFLFETGLTEKSLNTNLKRLNISYDYWVNNILGSTYNHKVKEVRFIDERVDTYNMEVDHEDHNYLLDAGIFIKNSTASQEDIRFSKTIKKIQDVVIAELEKIAVIHLILQGYTKEEVLSFSLSLTAPSDQSELEKLELLQARLDFAESALNSGLYDTQYVYTEVLNHSEQEMKEIQSRILQDKINEKMNENILQSTEFDADEMSIGSDDTDDDTSPPSGEGSRGGLTEPSAPPDSTQLSAPSVSAEEAIEES